MKRLLKLFVAWLDRKWPDQVVLSSDMFLALLKRIDDLEKSQVSVSRVSAIEAEINKFNMSLGFAGKMAQGGPFQR